MNGSLPKMQSIALFVCDETRHLPYSTRDERLLRHDQRALNLFLDCSH
jgi:hypothetical protein